MQGIYHFFPHEYQGNLMGFQLMGGRVDDVLSDGMTDESNNV